MAGTGLNLAREEYGQAGPERHQLHISCCNYGKKYTSKFHAKGFGKKGERF
jgi:hypothetical protein